ncbi:MAG: hypothetical protein ABW022_04865 [Actinoplanes sp.]
MRIGRRRLGAAVAGLVLVVLLTLGAIAFVRWRAAGVAHVIAPPAGAVTQLPEGAYESVVIDRAHLIARGLRNDRGAATVRTYALPPASPWLQSRKLVATQLDHWEQIGDCTDNPEARLLECAWREPTRWWPREVRLTMLRPPPSSENREGWPDRTFVIVGSARGDW